VNGAPTSQQNGAGSALATRQRPKSYNSARLTALLQPLLQGLLHILADTKANVERRFSLTSRERELEQDAPAPAAPPAANGTAGGDEEEEEERIYNPLKLPLGWDGKPIPYWLFKLHGLGVEYRCEICSDGVYMGRYDYLGLFSCPIGELTFVTPRKNFDRHFQVSFTFHFRFIPSY
jgi:splicing factor 3A subunit 3